MIPSSIYGGDSNPFVATASSASNLKKRKRDPEISGNEKVWSQHSGFILPPSIQHVNAHPVFVDYHGVNQMNPAPHLLLPGQVEVHARPRLQPSLSKRRRLLQQQQSQWLETRSRSNASSSTAAMADFPVTIDHGNISPQVSPKTIPANSHNVTLPPPLLRPCHICHRRPTTRVMLDAYADCELCGERACYICLRECDAADCRGRRLLASSSTAAVPPITSLNPDGDLVIIDKDNGPVGTGETHEDTDPSFAQSRQRRVCSWCAIEVVSESGDDIAWCLDCTRG
ncbi:hypothetical protein V8E54_001476 [Elaphomyces granulatus]